MFYIFDGREAFYQWDLNQKLIINDKTIAEVHFSNTESDSALICEVYEADGLRVVNVPNILLQKDWTIKAYGFCNIDNCTKHSQSFTVISRKKPSDYVYTETEVKRWEDLEARANEALEDVAALEKSTKETITNVESQIETINSEIEGLKNPYYELVFTEDTSSGAAYLNLQTTLGEHHIADVPLYAENGVKLSPDVSGLLTISLDTSVIATTEYVDNKIGDVESALDAIISLQNSYIGGAE